MEFIKKHLVGRRHRSAPRAPTTTNRLIQARNG